MNDATLSLLVPSTGSLKPGFSTDITDYTVVVPYSVTDLIVTGRTSDSNATMNPSDGNISFKNLTASTSVEQSITVTSVNGVTTKEYKVKIVQESNTTMLSDLTVSTGTLSPAFNPFIKNYTVTVPYSVTNLIVTGKKSDANATMDPPDGNLLFMNLAAGISEKKSIRITSKNKRVKNEYNVKVIRSGEIYTSETIGKLMFVPAGSFQRDLNSDCISNIIV